MYLEEPSAKIMVIDDFVTNAECNALITATDGHMQVGTLLLIHLFTSIELSLLLSCQRLHARCSRTCVLTCTVHQRTPSGG